MANCSINKLLHKIGLVCIQDHCFKTYKIFIHKNIHSRSIENIIGNYKR